MEFSVDRIDDLATYLAAAIGVLILLYHEYKLLAIKDYKEKYDYVNLHEIRYFWYAVVAFLVAAALFSNKVFIYFDLDPTTKLLVRLFYTGGFFAIAYYLFSSLVKIMYPKVVEKRLQKIRNTPRVSPAGNIMRKLHEHEEDVHLDQSQIDEEASNLHSVDYDVWLDEKTGHKKVEKYLGYMHAEECSECGFFTMKISSEEIEKKPTTNEDGLLLKHYRCSYCKHREAREVVIGKLSSNVS
ncbi:MAG TPA: hypothetical protein VFE57_05645 [Cyclobacteriaceae bacterium]|jgi:hypothetical protein|nr:hypothetical protein [Cyclobacteriaceae bacterium]